MPAVLGADTTAALRRHGLHLSARPALLALGGLELAALTGAIGEAARRLLPVVLDGYATGLIIPDLPLDEQRRIEREVSARAALDDASTAPVRLQVRLAEYRDALITEAENGQLDVRAMSDVKLRRAALGGR